MRADDRCDAAHQFQFEIFIQQTPGAHSSSVSYGPDWLDGSSTTASPNEEQIFRSPICIPESCSDLPWLR